MHVPGNMILTVYVHNEIQTLFPRKVFVFTFPEEA